MARASRLYRAPRGAADAAERSFPIASVSLLRPGLSAPVRYNGCIAVGISGAGLHLRVWRIAAGRHAPLLIPWSGMERVEPDRGLLGRTLTIHPHGTRTRIRLHWPAEAVDEVMRAHAARPAQPAAA